MSSSSAVYSVTQRSVLSSSNAGNVPSQLAVADPQGHEQVCPSYVLPHKMSVRTRLILLTAVQLAHSYYFQY